MVLCSVSDSTIQYSIIYTEGDTFENSGQIHDWKNKKTKISKPPKNISYNTYLQNINLTFG